MEFKTVHRILKVVIISVLLFSSCRNADEISIHELSEYPQPQTVPLELTEPQPLHWDTLGQGHLKPTVFPLDFSKLKAMPYDPDGFKPVTPTVTSFNFDELPTTTFTPENAEEIPLKWETTLLPAAQPTVKFQKPNRIKSATIDVRLWNQLKDMNIHVYSLVKDTAGVLWIGGNKLLRFDGTMFTTVYEKAGSIFYNLQVGTKGNLLFWEYGSKGESLNKLDLSNNEVHSTSLEIQL